MLIVKYAGEGSQEDLEVDEATRHKVEGSINNASPFFRSLRQLHWRGGRPYRFHFDVRDPI